MPPIYYTESVDIEAEVVEGRPTGREKKIITRFYTEFDPDPSGVLERLFSDSGDGLPPIFYEIENFNSDVYKRIPEAVGIKPLSLNIEDGSWGDQINWTAQWEELGEPQPPFLVCGINLYSWAKSESSRVEANEYLVGHNVFGGSPNSAGYFTHKRVAKPKITVRGKYIGDIKDVYGQIRSEIEFDKSIVGFNYSYNPYTKISDVSVEMEAPEAEDA